jgi:hypothetical protein
MNPNITDAELIANLGGPAEVCRLLGFDPQKGGVQRVHNWTVRGIPPLLRWQRQDVFGPPPANDADTTQAAAA